ncbi:hypothetical protein XENTR_v10023397 [Xenopus tropicalis]|uniref:Serine protease 27 n=1 Tax=Xenopus tropicalis TaxID=8364 RepID=A0A7D9N0H9_XENTR|nr:serine protease 27 [Xenopus tropicalis]KAE8578201.1 hypothetical protein XENTR_v10023397 [Xenopus tropicalis]|eukprot:XP_002939724.1 PREDICTED: serine protease 27-like [Xenopus tropicalis]
MDWFHLVSALLLLNLGCGKPVVVRKRMVGGKDATKGQNPWQAIVWVPGKYYCGGSLISSNLVLTAAHCFEVLDASSVVVILGAYKITGNPKEEIPVQVKQIIIHPSYNESDNSADIALLQLSQNVPFTRYILPVLLPTTSTVFLPGQSCVVTGWGYLELNKTKPKPVNLQEAEVRLMSAEQCRGYYESKGVGPLVGAGMICAVDILGRSGPCLGDSGGPLVCYKGGQQFLVGVVTFASGCGGEPPAVYTSVSAYLDWIKNYMECAED